MKQAVTRLLRNLRLLRYADYMKFLASAAANLRSNTRFRREHPDVALPPAYMLYESFGKLDYRAYFAGGRESAEHLLTLLRTHGDLSGGSLCEWGCGPARLLRHMPDLTSGEKVSIFGADYNRGTIAWCREHIERVAFVENDLMPPLVFDDGRFDAVYCVSVFTHLSRGAQTAWLREILRVLKPGGLFLMTVHGDSTSSRLTKEEAETYRDAGCVERGGVAEGARTYTAYNSPVYMREEFLRGLEIVEFIAGGRNDQDIWIVRK